MSQTSALLREIRERGLTQSEIRRRTGIPQPRLSKWEKGHVPQAADDALRLKILRDELVASEPTPPGHPPPLPSAAAHQVAAPAVGG